MPGSDTTRQAIGGIMSQDQESHARLDGSIAVVTGGTQGLGEGIARMFAARGAAGLVITGRNAANGARVAAELQAAGTKTVFVAADLALDDAAGKIFAAADVAFGRVDVLVNAAGVTDRGTVLDTTPALWDHIFAVNVKAPFFLMQEAAKRMRRDRVEGAIINILSMSAHGGQPFLTPYSTSKGALLTLTRNAAYALMPDRIRVNGLAIGWMNTPGEDAIVRRYHGAEDGWLQTAMAAQPFGRLLEIDEVSRAVCYLASPESGMMTGSIIDFDQSVRGAHDEAPHPKARLIG
jgi:NAD(P)-dependent dehydrogenase (short-subunit alcohol dehydrogenase family)